MKFPKLGHTVLCQLILYAPVILLFSGAFVCFFTADKLGDGAWILGFSGLGLLIATLIYLIACFKTLIMTDLLFAAVRSWQKGRRFYTSNRCGKSRSQAEAILARRGKRYGKLRVPISLEPRPLWIRYRYRRSATVFWSIIEKICMVYSVEHLDMAAYRSIMRAAEVNTKGLRRKTDGMFFLDKAQRKAPSATAAAVIILADFVEDAVIADILKERASYKEICVYPCVADFGARRFYLNGMPETYMLGMMGKPSQNFALSLIKSLVFGGRLPLRENDHYIEWKDRNVTLDMSLWNFLRSMKTEMKEAGLREKRIAKNLPHGGVYYKDELVYAKLGKRTAVYLTERDENDERRLVVMAERRWSIPRTAKMAKKDYAEIKRSIKKHLETLGHSVIFEETEEDI